MKISPIFSIIVPVYKTEKYLFHCIDSILNQSFENFELILIDDGSPDDCPKICDEYAKKDSRITVIHQQNAGVSVARQKGVEVAKGKYLAFVDSDDWVEHDFLISIKKSIDKYSPDIICFGGYFYLDEKKRPVPFPMVSNFYSKEDIIKEIFPYLIEDSLGKYFPNELWRKIILRQLYLSNQVVDCKIVMGEDSACVKPCVYHANSIYIDDGLYYNYRRIDSSITVSGRPLLWDGPYLISEHFKKRIDIDKYDFKEQIYRNIVHNIFNVAVSQFSRDESFFCISKEIKKHLKVACYQEAIKKANFASVQGKMCKIAVRYRLCFIFYLRWFQKYHHINKKISSNNYVTD